MSKDIMQKNLDINSIGLGVDIEENRRFLKYKLDQDQAFLSKIFTKKELEYCFSRTNPSQHLCARFAAKEAAIKALKSLGFPHATYKDSEVVNDLTGKPHLSIRKFKVTATVSLSHNLINSIAVVLVKKLYGRN